VLNRDGLLELHAFDSFVALTASGVGGGSLVYSDLMVQPDDTFFKYFPAEISAEEMAPFYDRVRGTLHPSPMPERPPRTAVFERAVRSAGMPAARYPDLAVAWPSPDDTDRKASSSIFGCEYPGKRSMDRTYVPLALRYGADVRSLCEVVAVDRSRRGYRVRWLDHQAGTHAHADAQVVVLAAGTFGSLRLLYSARRDHSLEMPSALGRHFSLGGDMAASVAGFAGAGESGFGPCVGAAVFVQRHGEHRAPDLRGWCFSRCPADPGTTAPPRA
jgi:cholesterol oxidase